MPLAEKNYPMLRNIILIASTIILAMIAYAWLMNDTAEPTKKTMPTSQTINTELPKAPHFETKTIDNQPIILSDFKGKIILIHFWASWCAPCVIELPKLLKLAEDYPNDIVILALSTDTNQQKLLQFLTKKNLNTPPPNLKFIWDHDKSITQDLFQTLKLPETIITDRNMRMTRKITGDAAWDSAEIRTYLNSLIAQK